MPQLSRIASLLLGPTLLLVLLVLSTAWPVGAQALKSPKRGVAYGYHSAADLQALASGLSWWYNWGNQSEAGAASVYTGLGVEYLPMQWGKYLGSAPVTASTLAPLIPAGSRYLLGFNEPNFIDQSNLTPTQAAALWPQLQQVAAAKNLKLVSPAVNYCGNCVQENGVTYYSPVQYLDDFFAACPGCQVDYIAVHTYVCEENYLCEKIAELKKYGKPIWLTEFACGDLPASQITSAVQQKYVLDAVNYLEKEPAVFRYAWFSGRNNQIPNINLLGADGQLTALGQLYVGRPAGWEAGRLQPLTTTASSQETNQTGAANVADTDINTRWASRSGAGTQYVQLDFGSVRHFSRVLLTWEAAYAQDYQVQASDDGNTWITLRTVVGGDGGVDDHTALNGQGRYLRILATQRGTTYGYSLYEVEAFGAATPLPVTLTRFEATAQGPAVALSWATASEVHNQGFEVQRSVDGTGFTTLAFIPGAGTSSQSHTYQYRDASAQLAGPSYYRLRLLDDQGAATYSPVQSVVPVAVEAANLRMYPNPAGSQTTIAWQSTVAGQGRLQLTNSTGQVIYARAVAVANGTNTILLDLPPHTPGSYVLTLEISGEAPRRCRMLKAE